jgi:hypothetical protein
MRRRIMPLGTTLYYLRPDADAIDGGWIGQDGSTNLYAKIDEATLDLGDYIMSGFDPVNDVCKVGLSDPLAAPTMPMSVRYSASKSAATGSMELRVRLLQGNTQIASWTESNVPTTPISYTRELTAGEFAAITNFSDLYLEFRANLTAQAPKPASALIQSYGSVALSMRPPNTIQAGTAGFSGSYLNVKDYGALGNGSNNDQTAIQNALNAANTQGKGLYFPAGTYLHSGTLSATSVHINGAGWNLTNIRSTSGTGDVAIQMFGANVKLSNVTVSTAYSGARMFAGWNAAVFINPSANNFHVDHVLVSGSPSIGILNWGGKNGKITNCSVISSLADAIHNTNKANNILVDRCYTNNCEDDGIACVSYQGDGGITYNITATNNCIRNTPHGRSMSVVGGQDVTYENNYCSNVALAAGMIIATEPSYTTYGVLRATVLNSTFVNAGGTTTGHSVGFFTAPNSWSGTINDCRFENCVFQITDSRTAAGIRTEGTKCTNIRLINYRVIGCSPATTFQSGASIVQNTPWTSGAVGYTPVPCGHDEAFHHT